MSILSPGGTTLSPEEARLYDRQLRLWGVDAQQRLRQARVLLFGFTSVMGEVLPANLLSETPGHPTRLLIIRYAKTWSSVVSTPSQSQIHMYALPKTWAHIFSWMNHLLGRTYWRLSAFSKSSHWIEVPSKFISRWIAESARKTGVFRLFFGHLQLFRICASMSRFLSIYA